MERIEEREPYERKFTNNQSDWTWFMCSGMFLLSHYLEINIPNRMRCGFKTQAQDIFLLNKKYFRLKIQYFLQNNNKRKKYCPLNFLWCSVKRVIQLAASAAIFSTAMWIFKSKNVTPLLVIIYSKYINARLKSQNISFEKLFKAQ